jgi:hypothetical protein
MSRYIDEESPARYSSRDPVAAEAATKTIGRKVIRESGAAAADGKIEESKGSLTGLQSPRHQFRVIFTASFSRPVGLPFPDCRVPA